MATSYKLLGDGKYIDSTGIAHKKVALDEVLDNLESQGVAEGGSEGQVLVKASSTNYDTQWADVSSVTIKRWEADA